MTDTLPDPTLLESVAKLVATFEERKAQGHLLIGWRDLTTGEGFAVPSSIVRELPRSESKMREKIRTSESRIEWFGFDPQVTKPLPSREELKLRYEPLFKALQRLMDE